MSQLNQLPTSTHKSAKRVGRGYGSGKGGHTATRGQKGQGSRAGKGIPVWFEGGQLPLIKRLPMWRGKDRLSVVRPTAMVTLQQLNQLETDQVSIDTLRLYRLISARTSRCKVVARGTLSKALHLHGVQASRAARAQIEAAGGSVE